MKKYFFCSMLCSLLLFCKTPHRIIEKKQMEEAFIYDFKITYFKKLLLIGYNHSDDIKSVLKKDQSGYGEIILSLDDYHLLDSIVKLDNVVMMKDSLNGNRRAEGTQGKRILGYALKKYESEWLDSLAKARYYIYKKVNEDTGL
jgi:hypothetical protein